MRLHNAFRDGKPEPRAFAAVCSCGLSVATDKLVKNTRQHCWIDSRTVIGNPHRDGRRARLEIDLHSRTFWCVCNNVADYVSDSLLDQGVVRTHQGRVAWKQHLKPL